LWALLAATQVPDLLSFGFMAAGLEHTAVTQSDFQNGLQYLTLPVIHWSHGLFTSIMWPVLFGALAFLIFKDRRTSIILGLLIFSHWVLDFIVYPYMPLFLNDSPFIGIGIITSGTGLILGIILELCLIIGWMIVYLAYRKRTTIKVA
jgi:membrane-bound metal-dependent hydrolase YbcI (DUF457 family)